MRCVRRRRAVSGTQRDHDGAALGAVSSSCRLAAAGPWLARLGRKTCEPSRATRGAGERGAASVALPLAGRLVVDGVRLCRRLGVLLPDLDRLVRLAGDEARAGLVEGGAVDPALGLERARLRDCLRRLEVVA